MNAKWHILFCMIGLTSCPELYDLPAVKGTKGYLVGEEVIDPGSLKENTEQLRCIFDALPSDIPGNLHCITNPPESVMRYVRVSTVSSKTVFILTENSSFWK